MSAITLAYLGTAGWHLSAEDSALLIDPYFTRAGLLRVAVGRLRSDSAAVARYSPPADTLLVSHAHYDHLLDVPEAARLTGGRVHASPQGCALLAALGVPAGQLSVLAAGDWLHAGALSIEVYAARHRRILGRVPFAGPLPARLTPPLPARAYRMDELFSFVVCAGGVRVLVASGLDAEPAAPADVVLVGADASAAQLAAILGAARPRLVLPNHWDDMFRPLSRPTRPMLNPPARLALPRRIDLRVWAARVREAAPGARVLIPRPYAPLDLPALLAGDAPAPHSLYSEA